jgi:cytochrome c553
MLNLLLIFILTSSSMVFAESVDILAGKQIVLSGNAQGALACMTCHIESGQGMSENGFPQLSGMNPFYLEKQIKDFQNLQRINTVMQPIANALDSKDIANIAAYFSSLSPVENNKLSSDTAKLETGRLIVESGLWDKGVPACISCHGPNVNGVGENFPRLLYLGKVYFKKQILAFKMGTKNNDSNNLMKTVANKLTKKEIEAVSEYISSLTSMKTTEVSK